MITAMPSASAVVDEPAHLTAGLLALRRGDLTVNREHPPLVKYAAAAAATRHPIFPPEPEDLPRAGTDFAFAYARELLYHANDADRLLWWARLPVVVLTLAAGALVFLWGRSLLGPWAGVTALALFAFEPNLLAHGRLVTTDMGAACFSLAALACLERAQARAAGNPGRTARIVNAWDLLAGISLGLAFLTRYSSVLLVPIMALCLALDRRRPARGRWIALAATTAVALLVLQAGYVAIGGFGVASLFPLAHPATGTLQSAPLASMEAGAVTRWLPLAVPRLWLEGLDLARWKNENVEGPGYLNGRMSRDGWWSYYVLALAMKGTIPFLVLSVAGIGWLVWRGAAPARIHLLVPASALMLLTTALTRAQIGLRYVLPVIPLLCLAGAATAPSPGARRRAGLIAAAVLLLGWHAWCAVSIHPHHLAYFNGAAGGPGAGPRRLVDSNLDWGQDLTGLARFLKARGTTRVTLYYFGTAEPSYYGIQAVSPEPGWFAVSATHLAGVYLPEPDYLAVFRGRPPDADIGHSILLYHLETVPPSLTRPMRRP